MIQKYVVILALLLICQTGYSQNSVNRLFKEFASAEEVQSVRLGSAAMQLASFFTESFGIDGIEALEFSHCDKSVKERFSAAIQKLNDPKYEKMITAKEQGNHTQVLAYLEKDMIRELIILVTGNNYALVRIKGNIKPSDLEKVVKEHGNGC